MCDTDTGHGNWTERATAGSLMNSDESIMDVSVMMENK